MPTNPNADEDFIDATEADEPYEPSVAPPKLERADVLTKMRPIVGQAEGLNATIEQAAMNPRMRTEFIDAWRRWYGSVLGWHLALERLPFRADDALVQLRQREKALQAWRAGFHVEMNPPQPVAPPVVPEKPGILSTIPWWVAFPAALGVAVGGYYGIRWIFSNWFHGADDKVQEVTGVVDAALPNPKPEEQQAAK